MLIKAGSLRYIKGKPKYFQSSPEGKRGFCAHCGSRLVWQAVRTEDDWLTNVTVGSPDRPDAARMTRHICADTQLTWYRLLEELPKFEAGDAEKLIDVLRAEVRPNALPSA